MTTPPEDQAKLPWPADHNPQGCPCLWCNTPITYSAAPAWE